MNLPIIPILVCFSFLVLVVTTVYYYNLFVRKRNGVNEAESFVDVTLKKKFDLLPNLISIVKQFMNHETDLLTRLTELRSKAMQSVTIDDKLTNDTEFNKLAKSISLTAENYPNLKSSDNFIHLQKTLSEMEEQLSASRRSFNATATNYNNTLETIPALIFALLLGYKRRNLLNYTELTSKEFSVETEFRK